MCTYSSASPERNEVKDVPWLSPDPEKDKDLESRVYQDLTDDTGQDFLGDQACSGSLGVDLGVWQSSAH